MTQSNKVLQEFLKGKVIVKVGDITTENTDAIVNAANHSLLGGGGVDGAIHRAGGPVILEECKKLRETEFPSGLSDGEAAVTNAGHLSAWIVVHTVGPVWKEGDPTQDEKLRNCYWNSLKAAEEHGCLTAAFPAISTGVYHFPKERAAQIASETLRDYFESRNMLKQVRLVFFSEEDANVFIKNQVFENIS